MKESIETIIRRATGAERVEEVGVLQRLWSGYGSILRYRLRGTKLSSVIVKQISPPSVVAHPRGWNTDVSHQRKLRSYEVETAWYRNFAYRCGSGCRVPRCWAAEKVGEGLVLVLEDLDAAGFSGRRTAVTEAEWQACLSWLAYFHAKFLGESPVGLWSSGTYWHLETRPDELKALRGEDPELSSAAEIIDLALKKSSFQTLVHGDAKVANFCFSPSGRGVAAVDFQYVGGGCGMKDVAYFVGSCLSEEDCETQENQLLDFYFDSLRRALLGTGKQIDCAALEADWRALYPVAWTDFHRFLKGWSPGHWKINGYSERLARSVVGSLMPGGGS